MITLTRKVVQVERHIKKVVYLSPVLIFHVTVGHSIFLRTCGQEVLEKMRERRLTGVFTEVQDKGITAKINALQSEWETITGARLRYRQYMAPQKAPATAAAPMSMKLNDQICTAA